MSKQRLAIVIRVRISEAQHADVLEQAEHAGMTLSALIRQRTVNRPVISSADNSAAKRINQIGRMLKQDYPKDEGWASAEQKIPVKDHRMSL